MPHATGCLIDPAVTAEFCQSLSASGYAYSFADARPELDGYGIGRATFDWDAETELFGGPRGAWNQGRYGICVSEGTARAAQSSLYWALAFAGVAGTPVEIANEPIYGARNRYRQMSDREGGMYGADAARYLHECGLTRRGRYGDLDLSDADPATANAMGMRRAGVPRDVLAASLPVAAVHQVTTLDEARDGIAAGYFGAFCSNTLWCDPNGPTTRDADGFCVPVARGGHCVQLCGFYEDKRGNPVPVLRGSWGNTPTGGGRFKLADGHEVQPPEGVHAVHADDFMSALGEGELWLFSVPASPWRDANLKVSDLA